jgi:hypothetical protein
MQIAHEFAPAMKQRRSETGHFSVPPLPVSIVIWQARLVELIADGVSRAFRNSRSGWLTTMSGNSITVSLSPGICWFKAKIDIVPEAI